MLSLGMCYRSETKASQSRYLDDGRDEFLDEIVFQEVGPVVVDKVDDEPFDVRSVVILIGHDHHFSISEILYVIRVFVFLGIVQADDFTQIGDLGVVHHLYKE